MVYEFQKIMNNNTTTNEDRKCKNDINSSGKKHNYI